MTFPDPLAKASNGSGSAGRRRTHCSILGHFAEASQFDLELGRLLQRRLRLVVLVALLALVLFFVLNLFDPHVRTVPTAAVLHGLVVALTAWLALVVWYFPCLRLPGGLLRLAAVQRLRQLAAVPGRPVRAGGGAVRRRTGPPRHRLDRHPMVLPHRRLRRLHPQ